jgi:hypothetical protein
VTVVREGSDGRCVEDVTRHTCYVCVGDSRRETGSFTSAAYIPRGMAQSG